ncbi:MAG: hypothetical protein Q8N36_06730, partial [bacterium]|nr:hypothetical protein [bacterium]
MTNESLRISSQAFEELNSFLTGPNNMIINEVLRVVHKYGTPQEINARADEARSLPNLLGRLKNMGSP